MDLVDFTLTLARAIRDCKGITYVIGNGGSCADAMHFAGEFRRHRVMHLMDAATITAIANDVDYQSVFSEQIIEKCYPGDILICLSTSGKSINIIRAVAAAAIRGVKVFCLLGKGGGILKEEINTYIVPSDSTPQIQEEHMKILHSVWMAVE